MYLDPKLQAFFEELRSASTASVSGKAVITASPNITTASVEIIGSNPKRIGLSIYNQSANTVYVSLVGPVVAATRMTVPVATFATVSFSQLFPGIMWTGPLYGIRNSGTGPVLVTEILKS